MLPSTDCFLFELSYRKESKHTDVYIFKNMSMLDFFRYLYTRKDFRVYYNDILARNRFDDFMLEFPVTSYSELYKTQCVFRIIQTRFSNLHEDHTTYDFTKCSKKNQAIAFQSITKRSFLVIPCLKQPHTRNYCRHIAEFSRHADPSLIDAFWKKIGKTVKEVFSNTPLQKFRFHFHGKDISWLHAKFTYVTS